ncbi:MAG: Ribonuclease HIII [Chlamydiae bacterium]|nr:Ribonuclease HIII [Chlamydiota bacterium]
MASFVKQIDLGLEKKLKNDLKEQDFEFSCPQYTCFQAKKKHLTVTLYTSGKLVVQGKNMQEFIEFYLEPLLNDFSYSYKELYTDTTPHIGSDEAGKGDFFGPLCVCAAYASEQDIRRLLDDGIKDSKTISDKKILKLTDKIRQYLTFEVIAISPVKYNLLYETFQNLNELLAWGHARAIHKVYEKTGCDQVLVDQFAKKHVLEKKIAHLKIPITLVQRTKAEEDVVVAAASVLARHAFLKGMEQLEKIAKCPIPKGASKKVIETGYLLREKGFELKNFAKTHFKTHDEILKRSS